MYKKLFIITVSVFVFLPFAASANINQDAKDSLRLISGAKNDLTLLERSGEIIFAGSNASWEYRRWVWYVSNVIDYVEFIEEEVKKGKDGSGDWNLILENALKAEDRLYNASEGLDHLLDTNLIRFKWLSQEFVFKDCIQNLREAQNLIYAIKTEALMNLPPSNLNK